MISVQTNVPSLSAQRNLNSTNRAVQSSISKLSSGFRINSARDDAAGLAISEEMKGDLRSFQQASRNANDAISLLQTAEGGMDDITGILHRMRELSMQSASDGVNDTQRGYIQTEITELQAEVDRISSNTDFNGTALLDGSLSSDFQVGLDAGDTINVALGTAFDAATLGVDAGNVDLSTKAGASSALAAIDTALESVSSFRAEVGAKQNRMDVVVNNLSVQHENLAAANGRIRDLDIASEMASFTKNQILMQAGTSMLAQANSSPQVALSLLG